ncbi:30S ribosomal protein S8 [Patescibacteria group bacterium]|nr:30S ribosomal protein S8 [Patescibacteria group bacterium]MBU1922190.1 30S ribosomal protein S8 [Patescibacteria group bacterium]
MFTDPIADMLTRIRNALMVRKGEVLVPYSNIKFAIANILVAEKYIEKVEKVKNQREEIKIKLKYEEGKPSIESIKRISKPGRRIYSKNDKLPRVLGGRGFAIVSTPQGLMTEKQARAKHLGGEIICEIY